MKCPNKKQFRGERLKVSEGTVRYGMATGAGNFADHTASALRKQKISGTWL